MLAHLLKYDSVHGVFDAEVSSEEDNLIVNGKKVRVYAERDPAAFLGENLTSMLLLIQQVFSATKKIKQAS